MAGKILNFPESKFAEKVGEEQLLILELMAAKAQFEDTTLETAAREAAFKKCNKAVKALRKFYQTSTVAEVTEHPALTRKKKLNALRIARMTIMVKMQQYIHTDDLSNPEYLKLSQQMSQVEGRIELMETSRKRLG